jgi:dTDP-4-amino-4,6-dideoxygalactose transaminase
MDKISAIASRHGLTVIEDASHALGACWHGRPIGSLSDMTVFSFHPVKHITTGEGGAVATSDSRIYELISTFRTHGITRDPAIFEYDGAYSSNSADARSRDAGDTVPGNSNVGNVGESTCDADSCTQSVVANNPDVPAAPWDNHAIPTAPWYYEQQLLGYNYRLTDIQAALGLSQLKKLPAFLRRRKEIAHMYDEALDYLSSAGLLTLQKQLDDADSAWHLYVVRIGEVDANPAIATSAGNTVPSIVGSAPFARDAAPSIVDSATSIRDIVFKSLKSMGIDANLHYIPVYLHPYYRKLGYKAGLCPVAEQLYSSVITLPLYPSMPDIVVEYVAKCIKGIPELTRS